jgi:protein TonB
MALMKGHVRENSLSIIPVALVYEEHPEELPKEPQDDHRATTEPFQEVRPQDDRPNPASKKTKSVLKKKLPEKRKNYALGNQNQGDKIEEVVTIIPSPGNQKPSYPLQAREEAIEGMVFLRLSIDSSGQVINAIPLEPFAHPLLERAALKAVRTWTFAVSGVVGTVSRDQAIEFKL